MQINVTRKEKEQELLQNAKVVWLTGLSGSGKTTNAVHLERLLMSAGYLAKIIDGDDVRTGLNKDLGFSIEDRTENIRRVAEVSKMFVENGTIVISCFVSPTEEIRKLAKSIIGEDDFIEVFINAPISVCEKRDVKGLYQKARTGEIKEFTGINSPFEPPSNPHLVINTDSDGVEETSRAIFNFISNKISFY